VSLPRIRVVMLGAFQVHVYDQLVVETAWRRRKERQRRGMVGRRSARARGSGRRCDGGANGADLTWSVRHLHSVLTI